jgi:DJ-1 family protein
MKLDFKRRIDMERKKVALFLTNGFEELEALAPVDLMRRANIEVDTISINQEKEVVSSRKITVLADKTIRDVNFDEYEMVVLPGGPGTKNYFESKEVLEIVKKFAENKKVGAICAAPTVLASLGILENRKAICFPACEPDLEQGKAILTREAVVKDGNIITSRGAGTAIDFGLALIKELLGEEISEKIGKEIVYY